jgi:hypothetical protein
MYIHTCTAYLFTVIVVLRMSHTKPKLKLWVQTVLQTNSMERRPSGQANTVKARKSGLFENSQTLQI